MSIQNEIPQSPKKKLSIWKIGCLSVIGLIVLIGIIGAFTTNEETAENPASPEVQSKANIQSSEPKEPAPSAVIEITSSELYKAYKNNEVAADNKYKDKILRVTGRIDSIGKDILDTPYISFGDGLEVQAMFDDEDKASELGALQSGQTVTVTGKCDGMMIMVILRDCKLE